MATDPQSADAAAAGEEAVMTLIEFDCDRCGKRVYQADYGHTKEPTP